MKKLFVIVVALLLLTACNDEKINVNNDDNQVVPKQEMTNKYYSNDELIDLVKKYRNAWGESNPQFIDAESEDKNIVTIHLYDIVDNHTATYDWYYINKYTAIGKNFLDQEIDLKNYTKKVLNPSEKTDVLFHNLAEADQFVIDAYNNDEGERVPRQYLDIVSVGDATWHGLNSRYASSSLLSDEYNVNNLNNMFIDNCWCEGTEGDGIGEIIDIGTFGTSERVWWFNKIEKEEEQVSDVVNYLLNDTDTTEKITQNDLKNLHHRIRQIGIINGNAKNDELWKANNRVKKLKVTIDDKLQYELNLEDTKDLQFFNIGYANEDIEKEIHLKCEIMDVYNGETGDNTSLTSLYLIGDANVVWGGR